MATTSFEKDFVISDERSIKNFKSNLSNPRKIKVSSRNLKDDRVKGIQLLKQKLLALETC
jgi:hypothetical protein